MITCDICEQEFDELETFHDNGYGKLWCDECDRIIKASDSAIALARQIGVPKYGPSSWRETSLEAHLINAYNHLAQYINENTDYTASMLPPVASYDIDEDHLSHAICRLAMAKALK